MKSIFPNTVTLGNLLCGIQAIILIFDQQYGLALLFILAGAILDFFDGFVARLMGVSGELGKQLDSLADTVSFGVAPGLFLFQVTAELPGFDPSNTSDLLFRYLTLLIPLFSALRLAKFNIDERQTSEFIGLPTPANTLFVVSIGWLALNDELPGFLMQPWFFGFLAIVSSYLLNAPIRMFSLKGISLKWKGNEIRLGFILVTILLILFLRAGGIPIAILLYLIISMIRNSAPRRT